MFYRSGIEQLSLPIAAKEDVQTLEKARNTVLYSKDDSLLFDRGVVIDIDNIQELPDGRFATSIHGLKFHCFFHRKKGEKLYVILNGSKTAPPPEFKRWSWYNVFEGSVLNIADPSYTENAELGLGWYYGTVDVNYREYTVELIKKISAYLGVENKDICFYASSGGGAAALHCGGLIEGCTVIAINPQIFLKKYHYAPTFSKITGIDLSKEDKWHRENGAYFIEHCPKTSYLLVENLASPDDFVQIDLLEKTFETKFCYGLNRMNNLGIWLYDIGSKIPHNAQEDQILYFAIDRLAKRMKSDEPWENLNSDYLIISEMWRKNLLLADQVNELKKLLANGNVHP